jgi:hypothetical protein
MVVYTFDLIEMPRTVKQCGAFLYGEKMYIRRFKPRQDFTNLPAGHRKLHHHDKGICKCVLRPLYHPSKFPSVYRMKFGDFSQFLS